MALFQPTNIIPSSFTVGVMDAVKDVAQISWQVNGNSAMTAYKIDFYKNDTDSTEVADATTGKINDGIPSGGYYGIDRFGQPKMFVWSPLNSDKIPKKWTEYNSKFANGVQFKFKITQYWQENGEEKYVEQLESSVFIFRSQPSANIQRSANAEFSDLQPFPSGSKLPASIGYFVCAYSQEQGAPVREVRWQIATWVNGQAGDILADTGNIDTPTLQYSFNGFFIGNEYAVRCSGKADYQTYGTQDFDSGWTHFTAQISDAQKQSDYTGNFTVQCLPQENASLLEWEAVEVIPPSFQPEGFAPTTYDGTVTIPKPESDTKYAIEWRNKTGVSEGVQKTEPLNFTPPWSAVWKANLSLGTPYVKTMDEIPLVNDEGEPDASKNLPTVSGDRPYPGLAFNADGSLLVYSTGQQTYLCRMGEKGIGQQTELKYNGESISSPAVAIRSDPVSGESFVVVGIYVFRLGRTGQVIESSSIILGGDSPSPEFVVFSPVSNSFVLSFSTSIGLNSRMGHICAYTIMTGAAPTLVKQIVAKALMGGGSRFSYYAEFSPNGTKLLLYDGVYNVGSDAYDKVVSAVFSRASATDCRFYFNSTADKVIAPSLSGSSLIVYELEGGAAQTKATISVSYDVENFIVSRDFLFMATWGKGDEFSNNGYVRFFSLERHQASQIKEKTFDVGTSSLFKNAPYMTAAYNDKIQKFVLVCCTVQAAYTTFIFSPLYDYRRSQPQGELFVLTCSNGHKLSISRQDSAETLNAPFAIKDNSTTLATLAVPVPATSVAIIITPLIAMAIFRQSDGTIAKSGKPLSFSEQTITAVSVYGGDDGATISGVAVYKGNGSNVLVLYDRSPEFEPAWNVPEYDLYMAANFNEHFEGGTGTASGGGFRIYRREVGSNILTPIATLQSTTTSMKDFGIRSRKAYTYLLYAYDINEAFMQSVENDTVVATCFRNYSLLVCDYDSENDAYHVRKQYLFALNLTDGAVSNNNSPSLNANFTAYPTRMPSTQNYASGTLQGLIGAIYTVPALVEQIGGFKHTVKPSTMDYFDSVDLEKELYELSTAPYQLFLRDMKGHLRMVATNGAIAMTQDLKKRQLSTTISLPWVEIGDASDVTIIQTPDDYGWNNNEQVLDVRLDTDPTTGVLSATYPRPYEGTRFYLTGTNKEILEAETPIGVTPAQFDFSETATETDDGVLTVTAIVDTDEET